MRGRLRRSVCVCVWERGRGRLRRSVCVCVGGGGVVHHVVYLARRRVVFHVEEKSYGIFDKTGVVFHVLEKICGIFGKTEVSYVMLKKRPVVYWARRSVVFHVGEKTLSQRVIDGVSCSM